MKFLLQSRQTLKFVRPDAGLTRNEMEAMDFECGTHALTFSANHHLANMQILVISRDTAETFVLPLGDSRLE